MNILYDLDGTISDPLEGIAECLNYALSKLGHKERELAKYIGPSLNRRPVPSRSIGDSITEEALILTAWRQTRRTGPISPRMLIGGSRPVGDVRRR